LSKGCNIYVQGIPKLQARNKGMKDGTRAMGMCIGNLRISTTTRPTTYI